MHCDACILLFITRLVYTIFRYYIGSCALCFTSVCWYCRVFYYLRVL